MVQVSSRHKIAVSTARRNDIDAASTAAKILYYPDPQADGDAAPAGALLASATLTRPCGTVDATGLRLTSDLPGQAVAAGIIRWARIVDGDGNFVMNLTVRKFDDSDVASANFIADIVQVYPGALINLLSARIAEGG